MKRLHLLCFAMVLLAVPSLALADSISPETFTATIEPGGSVTIEKTVTVTEGATGSVDIFFLTDSTFSMDGQIAAVKGSASDIMNAVVAANPGANLAFGAGEYRDFDDLFVYRQDAAINPVSTGGVASTQAGINMWMADGGGDFPEANLYALNEIAKVGNTTGWRTGSTRILVWFGDAYGHDPSGGVTEAIATSALVTAGIEVQAIDVSPFGPSFALDTTGQATRITDATGGALWTGVSTGDLVDAIQAAIDTAISTYSSVDLMPVLPAGFTADWGGAIVGSFDRSVERTFDFTLEITHVDAPFGEYHFPVHALVDRGIVATEEDWITVTPEPSSLALLGLGVLGLGFGMYRRRKK